MDTKIIQLLNESINIKQKFVKDKKQINIISKVVSEIISSYKKGGKVIIFGNGGSAADAQHMVAELVGRYKKERNALNAICLNTNVSTLTALGNDYGYDVVFSRQLESCADKGDIVIGISTSGNSPNVIKAMEVAKKIGCVRVGLTGATGGKLKQLVNYCICVPSEDTPRIQELHITLIHIICHLVEETIFG
ncbi:MAG: D-sedoheptulose 7-phosphate isomerase [Endomicrobia bacterium]|nr:D-sedoheptulose 7-phosphate isomerase [Endomicrobiia bacterium]